MTPVPVAAPSRPSGRATSRSTPRQRALLEVLADTDVFLTVAEVYEAVVERLRSAGLGVGLTSTATGSAPKTAATAT